jgi:hypothetical protein
MGAGLEQSDGNSIGIQWSEIFNDSDQILSSPLLHSWTWDSHIR